MFGDVYRGRRVFITGHTGFKGSWLSQWLIGLGADVAGYSLYVPSDPSHFAILSLEKRLRDVRGDVRDLKSLRSAVESFRPEIVFHLAAQPIVSRSYEDPRETFETNLMGMVNVLETCRSVDSIRTAVLITSDKCYENVEWEYGYREGDRLGGKDPYSASKACAEIAFASYFRSFFSQQERVKMATVRAGNVIGGGDWAKDRIVPDCMAAWAAGKSALIRNPVSTRPWQHVLEPLSGYLWLASRLHAGVPRLHGESFNFGPSASVNQSVGELVSEMQKTWGDARWHAPEGIPAGSGEAGLLKLCCDKALARLAWQPTLNFSETVRFTTDWYFRHYRNGGNFVGMTDGQIREYVGLAKERGAAWARS